MGSIYDRIKEAEEKGKRDQIRLEKENEILEKSGLPQKLEEIVNKLRRSGDIKYKCLSLEKSEQKAKITVGTSYRSYMSRFTIDVTDKEELSIAFQFLEFYIYRIPSSWEIDEYDLEHWFASLYGEELEPWPRGRQFLVKVSKKALKKLIRSLPKPEANELKKKKEELIVDC